MSVKLHLEAIARGLRPDDDGLLSACRFACMGGEVIGEESILQALAEMPMPVAPGATLVEDAKLAFLAGEGDALVADLYDGRVGRLWRVGGGASPADEPLVDVPFDPDMHQMPVGVLFEAEDFPGLAPEGFAAAAELAAALLAHTAQGHGSADADTASARLARVRLYVLRVVVAGDAVALLAAVHRLEGGPTRRAGFGHAVAFAHNAVRRFVLDPLPNRAWTPRL